MNSGFSRKKGSAEELSRRGQELCDRYLRDQVEPEYKGGFLVLDIETGECEIAADDLIASERLLARIPEAHRYGLRVGYPEDYRLGGRSA
ncbi:MAG: hypothetical protein IT210_04620 [Armatimonadetes bacterium]|nr:hypothetical protein [Armatimonadota bacterium]